MRTPLPLLVSVFFAALSPGVLADKVASPAYLEVTQVTNSKELTPPEKAAEEAMLRLRLLDEGLDIDELSIKFGESNTEALTGRLVRLVADGLLIRESSKYRLPAEKALVSNPILARVLGD